MIKKIQYTNQDDRKIRIEENKNLILIEEQNITEGNFLIFSDEPIQKEIETIYTQVPQEEFENQLNYTLDLDCRLSLLELGL